MAWWIKKTRPVEFGCKCLNVLESYTASFNTINYNHIRLNYINYGNGVYDICFIDDFTKLFNNYLQLNFL